MPRDGHARSRSRSQAASPSESSRPAERVEPRGPSTRSQEACPRFSSTTLATSLVARSLDTAEAVSNSPSIFARSRWRRVPSLGNPRSRLRRTLQRTSTSQHDSPPSPHALFLPSRRLSRSADPQITACPSIVPLPWPAPLARRLEIHTTLPLLSFTLSTVNRRSTLARPRSTMVFLRAFVSWMRARTDMRRDVQEIFRMTPHHKQVSRPSPFLLFRPS